MSKSQSSIQKKRQNNLIVFSVVILLLLLYCLSSLSSFFFQFIINIFFCLFHVAAVRFALWLFSSIILDAFLFLIDHLLCVLNLNIEIHLFLLSLKFSLTIYSCCCHVLSLLLCFISVIFKATHHNF